MGEGAKRVRTVILVEWQGRSAKRVKSQQGMVIGLTLFARDDFADLYLFLIPFE